MVDLKRDAMVNVTSLRFSVISQDPDHHWNKHLGEHAYGATLCLPCLMQTLMIFCPTYLWNYAAVHLVCKDLSAPPTHK